MHAVDPLRSFAAAPWQRAAPSRHLVARRGRARARRHRKRSTNLTLRFRGCRTHAKMHKRHMPRVAQSSRGAIAYVRRASTSTSSGSSESAQRRAIRLWAKKEKTGVLGWHVDGGDQARIEERPAIMLALASLTATGAKVLCVSEPSVLDRAGYARLVVEHLARHVGARVVYATAAGREEAVPPEVESALGAHERMLLRLRTMTAAELKRPRGALWGRCPWGYRFSPDGMQLEPFEPEQNVIAVVRHMRLSGLKLREIADELRRSGVVGRTGRPLGITRIFELLDQGRGSRPKALRSTV
jgi:DNA invertase Pin-like site-specific DNA recombinase